MLFFFVILSNTAIWQWSIKHYVIFNKKDFLFQQFFMLKKHNLLHIDTFFSNKGTSNIDSPILS